MWGSLIQSVECLHRKDWSPCKRKEFSFQSAFGLKAATLTVGLSSLLVCSAQFGLASPYHYLSQSLKIYLCVHTHTHTHTHHIRGFPGGSDGKESACNAGDLGLIPGSERSPGEGNGNPLQYSCLENSMDKRRLVGYSPWGQSWRQMSD